MRNLFVYASGRERVVLESVYTLVSLRGNLLVKKGINANNEHFENYLESFFSFGFFPYLLLLMHGFC